MNTYLFIFGAILAVVSAEAPLLSGPYAAPAPVYGPPRIIEPVAPYPPAIPAPVYGPPRIIEPVAPYPPAVPAPVYGPPARVILPPPQIVSNYGYEVYTPKRVEILAPYPAPTPIIKTGPYPAPAPLVIPAPAPVYGPPEVPVVPAPVYGPPPKIVLPAPEPVLTSYGYPVYTPQPVVTGPYPAPAPIVKIPEVPVAPHTEYGSPLFKIINH